MCESITLLYMNCVFTLIFAVFLFNIVLLGTAIVTSIIAKALKGTPNFVEIL